MRGKDTGISLKYANFFFIHFFLTLRHHLSASNVWAFTVFFQSTTMETIRQKQVGEQIRRYFSMILMQEGSNIYGNGKLVTVTHVKMTPDLLLANIYISVYGTEHKQEVILEMEDNHQRLKQALAGKIGKQMRRLPEIAFFLDDTIDEMYRVETLLNRISDEDREIGHS